MNASHTPGGRLDTAPDGTLGSDDEPEQPPSSRIAIEIIDETTRLDDAALARFAEMLRAVLEIALTTHDSPHDVRVAVVDDDRMCELHLAHSGIEGTTDVLTFDLRDDPSASLDVDLALCFDEAQRAAADRAHDEIGELVLYALHGVLHCLGFDDHDDDAFRLMHAREDEILREAGLGSLFAGGDS